MTRALVLLLGLALAMPAAAQTLNEAKRCAPADDLLDDLRYVRALSLDLRGAPPSVEELEALVAGDTTLDALLTEWLDSDAFATQVVRRHRSYLWNSLHTLTLINGDWVLRWNDGVWWRPNLATELRGGNVRCEDAPARFGPNGEILTTEVNGQHLEGWVEVPGYWAPGELVRICAFDARDHLYAEDGTYCGARYDRDVACGCGPNLQWCAARGPHHGVGRPEISQVNDSLAESLNRLIAWVVTEKRPYTELFTSRRAFVNGPLVHYFRHLVPFGNLPMNPAPVQVELLPDLEWTDIDEWRAIELPPQHAGILTHPAYLLRFMTNRSRADRFYTEFLCRPFQPPAGGIPLDANAVSEPDLQQRAGCKYCHALLEPAASHWGRWAQSAGHFLSPRDFPATSETCRQCAIGGHCDGGCCTDTCRRFYLTRAYSEAEEPYLGMLHAYAFRRPEHLHFIDEGPALLARTSVADNSLPPCVARRTAEWLLGREVDEPGDAEWIRELTRDFSQSDYQLQTLVKDIVLNERYRRVR